MGHNIIKNRMKADAFTRQTTQGNPMVSIASVLCITGILAIPSYFFGVYWLANPAVIQADGTMLNCWAPNQILAGNATNFEILAEGAFPSNPAFLNVTQGFLVWFEWGFLLFVIQAISMLSGLLMFCAPALAVGSGLGCCCVSCGQSVWFIVGMVLRWRTAGSICSGVNESVHVHEPGNFSQPGVLFKSGTFMNVWIIITLSINGCLCLTSLCCWLLAVRKG